MIMIISSTDSVSISWDILMQDDGCTNIQYILWMTRLWKGIKRWTRSYDGIISPKDMFSILLRVFKAQSRHMRKTNGINHFLLRTSSPICKMHMTHWDLKTLNYTDNLPARRILITIVNISVGREWIHNWNEKQKKDSKQHSTSNVKL